MAHNANAYGQATFVVYWMINFFGMWALGLACENVAMIIGQPWTAMWLIFWVISNVSTAFYALDLTPKFYYWGYAWPLHNSEFVPLLPLEALIADCLLQLSKHRVPRSLVYIRALVSTWACFWCGVSSIVCCFPSVATSCGGRPREKKLQRRKLRSRNESMMRINHIGLDGVGEFWRSIGNCKNNTPFLI